MTEHSTFTHCANHFTLYTSRSHDEVSVQSCADSQKFSWTTLQQGFIFAAQNVGSLFMLVTGTQADRLNSKYSICVALILLIVSNALIPVAAPVSMWLVFVLRWVPQNSEKKLKFQDCNRDGRCPSIPVGLFPDHQMVPAQGTSFRLGLRYGRTADRYVFALQRIYQLETGRRFPKISVK